MPQSAGVDCGKFLNYRRSVGLEILYKDKNLIAVYKPSGLPSQSDTTGDEDALTLASRELILLGENKELWLVHRLDRVVGGILVFARNKKYAALLSSLVSDRGIKKEYLAVVDGEAEGGVLRDYLYKDSAKGKAFVVDSQRKGVKEAELEYERLFRIEADKGVKTLVRIDLHTGRFHQIRVQFSSRGTPISGDGKYGSRDSVAKTPALFAYRLSFTADGKDYQFTKLPCASEYPWSLFDFDILGE